nr:MAG TPA: hypothetical protein [Caudoviricetes sp.]
MKHIYNGGTIIRPAILNKSACYILKQASGITARA